ncbi:globin domain-containing protein [Methylobacterium sp. WSM2598]|uniref:globin domain-containing protein n=1 Tax=Methylobacterium sp. WSM2598 TaxID=398261 RepID=UPI00035D6A41|nr:globin domain-containing protein [Methylobacterium sp. WSM2598]
MNPDAIAIIRFGFRHLAAEPDHLAVNFYARLFDLGPSLRPLFNDDLTRQGRKLVAMLAQVVQGLDRLGTIVADVRALGRRHVGYGVVPAHYATVGAALLSTLADRLGATFDAEARSARTQAYTLLAEVMLEASREAAPAHPALEAVP